MVANQQYVETSFAVTASLAVFTATAVGGLGSAVGAVAGAALVEGSAVFLPPSWQLFPSAFGVLLVLLAFPGGSGRPLLRPARRAVAVAPGGTGSTEAATGPVDGRAAGAGERAWPSWAGAALFPLAILFSLQLLDQATQSAFNVLIPNVRDAFHLSNAEILLIVALAGAAALGTLPVVGWRTGLSGCASPWSAPVGAAFSVALGLAPRRWCWPSSCAGSTSGRQ